MKIVKILRLLLSKKDRIFLYQLFRNLVFHILPVNSFETGAPQIPPWTIRWKSIAHALSKITHRMFKWLESPKKLYYWHKSVSILTSTRDSCACHSFIHIKSLILGSGFVKYIHVPIKQIAKCLVLPWSWYGEKQCVITLPTVFFLFVLHKHVLLRSIYPFLELTNRE